MEMYFVEREKGDFVLELTCEWGKNRDNYGYKK